MFIIKPQTTLQNLNQETPQFKLVSLMKIHQTVTTLEPKVKTLFSGPTDLVKR